MRCRRSTRQPALNATDGVLYGRVNLILDSTVTSPTRRHFLLPKKSTANAANTSLCMHSEPGIFKSRIIKHYYGMPGPLSVIRGSAARSMLTIDNA